MNKHIFKTIQKAMIGHTCMDFYFPENIQHKFIEELDNFKQNALEYRQQLFSSTSEIQLKMIGLELTKQIQTLDKLSKEDFPEINYFFSKHYTNSFNFEHMKEVCEKQYATLNFLQKLQLSIPLSVPEVYTPSNEIKKAILEDFGFKYLHLSSTSLSTIRTEAALKDFIKETKSLMQKINKPLTAISIHGEIGLMLEENTPIYGHIPKCIGITPDIESHAILHEFTHAVDNYVFHKLSGINEYASDNLENFEVKDASFLPVYQAIKEALFKICNMKDEKPSNMHEIVTHKSSFYYINCCAADEDLFMSPGEYYKRPCEILARMVEGGEYPDEAKNVNANLANFVYLKPEQNPYLSFKDILFSVLDKKLENNNNLTQVYNLPANGKTLPTIGKFKV